MPAKLSQVFMPGGLPDTTYNPRNQHELETKFKRYLDNGLKLLSLTGPTKSGKTVLCNRLIPDEGKRIWINGGDIREEDDFWTAIVDDLGLFTDVAQEKNKKVEQSIKGRLTAGASAFFKAESSIEGGFVATDGSGQTVSRSSKSRATALLGLKKCKKPIIIDDFHYIPKKTQVEIIRSLKGPIAKSLRVVILSVPHRAFDVDKITHEMSGRVDHINIPPWNDDELKEIAIKGFDCLNVAIDEAVIDIFVQESYGNPMLMQEFCRDICLRNGIEEALPELAMVETSPDSDLFSNVIENIGLKTAYDLITQGALQRTVRKMRPLITGEEGDMYKAILMAIASTGPKMDIEFDELRKKLKYILCGYLPPSQITSTRLSAIEKEFNKKEMRVMEWDSSTNTLHLLDPFFAFYLRWAIRPKIPDNTAE